MRLWEARATRRESPITRNTSRRSGTATENERLLHEEQQAVLGQMGVRNAPAGVKIGLTAVFVVLVVAAIVGLGLFIVFR